MTGEFSTYECESPMECGGICVRLYGHQGEHQCVGGHLDQKEEEEPLVVTFTADTTKFTQAMRRADRTTQGFAFTWRGGWQKLAQILRARV